MNASSITIGVTVFWDFENCAVPSSFSGTQIVSAIRNYCLSLGGGNVGEIKNIIAIGNQKMMKESLRKELQNCGVVLHDVPSSHKPNQSDFAILVELFKFVLDNKPPHTVIIITGDCDFVTIINTMRNRLYNIVLIHGSQVSDMLQKAANTCFVWDTFLKTFITSPINTIKQPKENTTKETISKKQIENTSKQPKEKHSQKAVRKQQ